MRVEAGDGTFADLLREDGVRGDAFLLDEAFNLSLSLVLWFAEEKETRMVTRSRVFFARSLTKGLAMTGILSEAGTWPPGLLRR